MIADDMKPFDSADVEEDIWAKLITRGLKAQTPAVQAARHPAQKL